MKAKIWTQTRFVSHKNCSLFLSVPEHESINLRKFMENKNADVFFFFLCVILIAGTVRLAFERL